MTMNPIKSTSSHRRSPPPTAKAMDSAYRSFLSILPPVLRLRYNELRDSLSNLISSIDEGSDSSCLPLLSHKEELIEVQGRLTGLITSLDELILTEAIGRGYSSILCSALLLPQKEGTIEIQNKLDVVINSIDQSIYEGKGLTTKTIDSTSIQRQSPQLTEKAMESVYDADDVISGLSVMLKREYIVVQDKLAKLISSINGPIREEECFTHHQKELIELRGKIACLKDVINGKKMGFGYPLERRVFLLQQKREVMRIRDKFNLLTELIYGVIRFNGLNAKETISEEGELIVAKSLITSAMMALMVLTICCMLGVF